MASSNDSDTSIDFTDQMLHTGYFIDKYYTPVVCFCGALGNSLSLAVFWCDSKYRRQSSSYYLSALAISDTGFLLSMFLIWIQGIYGHVITSAFTCPLVMYLGQVTCFLSVYLIVAFSIERYVAVHNPFNKPRIFTRSKSRRVIIGLIGVASIAFSYVWIIAKVIEVKSSSVSDNVTNERNHLARAIQLSSFKNNSVLSEIQQIKQILMGIQNTTNSSYAENESERGMFENFLLEIVALETSKLQEIELGTEKSSESSEETVLKESSYYQCTVPEEYYKVSEIANYLDSVVTLIVPFMLITFLNVRIHKSLRRYMKERSAIISSSSQQQGSSNMPIPTAAVVKNNDTAHHHILLKRSSNSSTSIIRKPSSKSTSQRHSGAQNGEGVGRTGEERDTQPQKFNLGQTSTEVRVTKTLLLVSTVFLVLNLPLHFIRCAQFIQYMSGTYNSMDLLRAFQPWATMLFNTNFAVNFLLYCVSGRNFRKSLRRLVTSNNSKEVHSQLPRMSSQHGHHRSTGLPAERSPNVQRASGFEREATTVHRKCCNVRTSRATSNSVYKGGRSSREWK